MYVTTSGIASATPEHDEPERDQDRARVREDPPPSMAVPARVVEQHLGDASEEERLEADGEDRHAEELPVQREVDGPEVEVAEASAAA